MKAAVVMTILGAFDETDYVGSCEDVVLGIPEIRAIVEPKLGINSDSYLRFYLSKMVDAGYLSRMGRGMYKIAEEGDAEFDEKFQPANMPDEPIWRKVELCGTACEQEPTYARWISRTAAAKQVQHHAR